MQNGLVDSGRPPMWVIEQAGENPAGGVLRFGRHRIPLCEIAAVSAEDVRYRPVAGLALAAIVFVVVAGVMAFGVLESGLRDRFLIGAAFLAALGYFSLVEVLGMRALRDYEVTITLKSGRSEVFSSSDLEDVYRLLAHISPQAQGTTSRTARTLAAA